MDWSLKQTWKVYYLQLGNYLLVYLQVSQTSSTDTGAKVHQLLLHIISTHIVQQTMYLVNDNHMLVTASVT